jgi:membrane protein required for colicin V production
MTLVDWAIVVVLVMSIFGGLTEGFFRSAFALFGLLLGLVLAAWNYGLVAKLFLPIVRIEAVADTIGFLLIALLVMGLAAVTGKVLSKVFHHMGLGCMDRLAGAAFGFFQGALLVTVVILSALAFFPKAHWLSDAKLPKYFFGACHLSTHMDPADLAKRIRHALKELEDESPVWLHPGSGAM